MRLWNAPTARRFSLCQAKMSRGSAKTVPSGPPVDLEAAERQLPTTLPFARGYMKVCLRRCLRCACRAHRKSCRPSVAPGRTAAFPRSKGPWTFTQLPFTGAQHRSEISYEPQIANGKRWNYSLKPCNLDPAAKVLERSRGYHWLLNRHARAVAGRQWFLHWAADAMNLISSKR